MLRRVRSSWPFDILDVLFFVGLLIVTGFLAQRDVVLAGVVFGGTLMAYAFIAALPPRTKGDT